MPTPTQRLLIALTSAVAAGAAFAQTSASRPEDTVKLEAFAVTGSFLKRLEQEKALPVTIVTDEDIKTRGVTTPAELFASIPQAGRVPISESQASGADARGDIATVSLRGLGSGNTLVLLNGRRMAPHPISMPEGNLGVPSMGTNINVLPTAAIARVEVLRDGASAIYGTDATAGVVNTILHRDYEGVSLATRYGTTQHGGGTEWRATVAGGVRSKDRATKLVFNYDFLDREEIAHCRPPPARSGPMERFDRRQHRRLALRPRFPWQLPARDSHGRKHCHRFASGRCCHDSAFGRRCFLFCAGITRLRDPHAAGDDARSQRELGGGRVLHEPE